MNIVHTANISNMLQELINRVAHEGRVGQQFLNEWSRDFEKEVEAYIQFRIAKAKQDEKTEE